MSFSDFKYDITVVDESSLDGINVDGVVSTGCYVLIRDTGTQTTSTIYSDTLRTAKTAPITRAQFATDGKITFYGPNASYDVTVCHSDGSWAKRTVTPRTHTIKLNRDGADRMLVFPMVFNAGGTETDTGLDLPLGALVYDAKVEVVTVDATETVDVGLLSSETAGDADGFIDGVSVATAGIPALSTYTTGSNETYLSANLHGVLLASGSLGNDTATDVGSLSRLTHFVTGSNAVSVSYTPSSSDTFVGIGYIFYKQTT